jgi:hypothetical protein
MHAVTDRAACTFNTERFILGKFNFNMKQNADDLFRCVVFPATL